MTTTILVFNSSHEDASATPPRAQAFFRTQKRNPFRGRATTSRRAKPHASAFHARRTRRDVQIHKPRARFLSSASRPRLFLRALTREPHFRVQKRASWISLRYITATRPLPRRFSERVKIERRTLATVFSKSVGLAPASFTIFTRDISFNAVCCESEISEERWAFVSLVFCKEKKFVYE